MAYIYELKLKRSTDSFASGTRYIGQSNGNNKYYTGGGGKKVQAIRAKYGKDIFQKRKLIEGDFSSALLDDLEKHYIRLYATQLTGLNIEAGGSTVTPTKVEVHKYSPDREYVCSYPSGAIAGRSVGACAANVFEAIQERSKCKGFYWSKSKVDILDVPDPEIKYNSQEIHSYNLLGEYVGSFKSQNSAARKLGVTQTSVRMAIDNPNRQCSGLQFRTTIVDNCGIFTKVAKEVTAISEGGNERIEFPSLQDACRFVNIAGTITLKKAIKDKSIWKGYFWKFKDSHG